MKIVYVTALLTTMFFTLVSDVRAQDRPMAESEFSDVRKRANVFLSRPFRMRISIVEYSATTGLPFSTETNVSEQISPDQRRLLRTVKTATGVKTIETIWLGDKVYTKEGLTAWKLSAKSQTGRGTGSGRGLSTTRFVDMGEKRLGKKKARIYRVVTRSSYETARVQFEEITQDTYWVAEEGSWLKCETEFTRKSELGDYRSTSKLIYEYNPVLKIEAPIK